MVSKGKKTCPQLLRSSAGRRVKISFDLDGVLIGKPPLIPKKMLEYLYRGKQNRKLRYRFPKHKLEKFVRWLSHYPLLRPPLKSNLTFIRNLSKNKKYKLYAVSSRYSFLQSRTEQWFKKNNLEGVFEKVYLNTGDEQPHLFKEKILKKLKPNMFIEDDPFVVDYLKDRLGKTKIRYLESGRGRVDELLGKRKTKILIGISYYLPNISGLTIYAQNLAEELVKRGHVVKVLTSRHLKELHKTEKKNGVLVKRIWTPFIFGRGPIMPTYFFQAYRAVKKCDVVNIHIPQFEGVMLAIWARLLGKKIVLTHHCDLSNWPGLINQITEKITYLSLFVSGLLADKIVVYTKDYADHSNFLLRFKNKLVYTLPPVKIKRPTGELKKKYKNTKYKIGFAGRIAKEKGIEYLIETIPILKKKLGGSFKIFLAGPGKEVVGGGYQQELLGLINKHKSHLIFLGVLNQKQMADFYQMLDVLALPSTEKLESFGFVQVEAMFLGCPAIASNLPGVRMPTRLSGMGCVATPKNSEDLANKIIDVLKNKKKYTKNKKKIKQIFDYKKTINFYSNSAFAEE